MLIEPVWLDFEAKTVPFNASAAQRHDMKTCFYAGVIAMLKLLEEESITDPDGDLIEVFLTSIKQETCKYFDIQMPTDKPHHGEH